MTNPSAEDMALLLIAQGVASGLFPPGTLALLLPCCTPPRCFISVGSALDLEDGGLWASVPWDREQWARFDRLPLVKTWLAPLLARRYGKGAA